MVRKITWIKIVGLFVNDYNKRCYLRELACSLDKSHQTIKPYIEDLVKQSILIKTERKNLVEYGLNFRNRQIYDYLVIAEKDKLLERLDKDSLLKILFEKLSDLFVENTLIIFGSSAEQIKKGSDIDLLIIGKSKINKVIEEFEEVYNKKIHKVQISNLDKLNITLAKEIYKKHLILNDAEKIVRFFGGLYEKNKLV